MSLLHLLDLHLKSVIKNEAENQNKHINHGQLLVMQKLIVYGQGNAHKYGSNGILRKGTLK